MKKQLYTITLCGLLATSFSDARASDNSRSSNVHNHKKGEIMASYKYSTMQMKGNRNGTNDVSTADVLNDFMVSPTKMTMQMHMFGLMYGATDNLTIMGMAPYTFLSMDHVTRSGVEFETETKGIGDVKLSGLYSLYQNNNQLISVNAGISLPTGSIDKRDATPAGANQKLPYTMQLGSGTYDLLPAISYSDTANQWSWGSEINAVIRLGENENDYTLGNRYGLDIWAEHELTHYASASVKFEGRSWGNIDGADPELNPTVVPTARTDLRGGEQIDLIIGLNLLAPHGQIDENKFVIEAGLPIYQNLDGPQLETDYRLTVGWQLTF